MNDASTLQDVLYREKVDRARRQSPQEKFLDGLQLFDLTCRVMMDGIRMQHPGATDAEVMRMLGERLAIMRSLEDVA